METSGAAETGEFALNGYDAGMPVAPATPLHINTLAMQSHRRTLRPYPGQYPRTHHRLSSKRNNPLRGRAPYRGTDSPRNSK